MFIFVCSLAYCSLFMPLYTLNWTITQENPNLGLSGSCCLLWTWIKHAFKSLRLSYHGKRPSVIKRWMQSNRNQLLVFNTFFNLEISYLSRWSNILSCAVYLHWVWLLPLSLIIWRFKQFFCPKIFVIRKFQWNFN